MTGPRADELLEHRYQDEPPARTMAFLFRRERGNLAVAAAFFLIKSSPAVLMPVATARIIDALPRPDPLPVIGGVGLGMTLLVMLNVPTNFGYVRALTRATRTVENRLRFAVVRRVQHLSLGGVQAWSPGALQSKVLRDAEAVEGLTRVLFESGLGALLAIGTAVISTALRTPVFLLFFLLTVPVTALLIRSMRAALDARNSAFRVELEQMTARVGEMTTLLPLTRAHALEDTEVARVGGTFSRVRDAGLQLDAANAMFGAVSWMTFNVFNLLCLMVAAWAYATRTLTLTVGDVVMLTAFFGSLTGSVMALLNVAPQVTRGLDSLRSIGEVLQSPDVELNAGKQSLDTVRGEVHFEHVGLTYPGEGAAVTDVTFSARPGEVIALVGASGSGKSTLLNLVIGFVRPTSGRITLDGHDMASLDLRSYRRFVSVVPQDPVMFGGSVRDNVTYGLTGVPEARVRDALRHAHAEAFVDALPGGLDARVGAGGAPLSGGQRQRIAIARALIRDPRVLILDEATSALDTESEAHIQRALTHLMRGRTTFVVAHRLSTVRTATRILVLGGGQVLEAGTHEELMGLKGHYARLHAATPTP